MLVDFLAKPYEPPLFGEIFLLLAGEKALELPHAPCPGDPRGSASPHMLTEYSVFSGFEATAVRSGRKPLDSKGVLERCPGESWIDKANFS